MGGSQKRNHNTTTHDRAQNQKNTNGQSGQNFMLQITQNYGIYIMKFPTEWIKHGI